MDDLWFEDALLPSAEGAAQIAKAVATEEGLPASVTARAVQSVRGIVRVQRPRWRALTADEARSFVPAQGMRLYFVKLGFEFEIPPDAKQIGARFISASCMAYVWATAGQAQPKVYEVIPRELQEGSQRKVALKVEPLLKIENVADASLGSIGTDIMIGVVEPACVGYKGKNEQEPHWDLTPKSNALLGTRTFWMILEVPQACTDFRIAAQAEAKVQGFFGIIPLGSKHTTRDSLPSITIPAV